MPTDKFPEMPDLLDPVCRRAPDDMAEYWADLEEGETPSDYVWTEVGSLDRASGLFVCDECYVNLGTPGEAQRITGPEGRWVATRENLQALGVSLS